MRWNQASAELLRGLAQIDPKVQLAIASSLWLRQGIDFQPDFLQRSQQFYAQALDASRFWRPLASRSAASHSEKASV